jgi:hypothetical protein
MSAAISAVVRLQVPLGNAFCAESQAFHAAVLARLHAPRRRHRAAADWAGLTFLGASSSDARFSHAGSLPNKTFRRIADFFPNRRRERFTYAPARDTLHGQAVCLPDPPGRGIPYWRGGYRIALESCGRLNAGRRSCGNCGGIVRVVSSAKCLARPRYILSGRLPIGYLCRDCAECTVIACGRASAADSVPQVQKDLPCPASKRPRIAPLE